MNKHSRVCANIDLSAVMHNMEAMHQNIDPDTKIMAVIKADGYGHGAVPIAKEIEHLDYVYGYAAATVEEGMILRNNGIQKPILILGYIFPDQYEEVIQAEICPSVFTLEMAEELSAAAGAQRGAGRGADREPLRCHGDAGDGHRHHPDRGRCHQPAQCPVYGAGPAPFCQAPPGDPVHAGGSDRGGPERRRRGGPGGDPHRCRGHRRGVGPCGRKCYRRTGRAEVNSVEIEREKKIMEKYDLIIVGAGPAGIFTAVELLRHGSKKKMLLVEKGKPVEKRHCPKAELRQLPPHLRHHHRLFRCGRVLGRQAEPFL